MLDKAVAIIEEVASLTDSVILFHSLTGKDSMTLLDLLYTRFKRVVCVFMYVVKDLEHNEVFLRYAQTQYPNVEWYQLPHYCVYSYIKNGDYGCTPNKKQKQYNLGDLTDMIRQQTGIQWACYGFKQSDSMNRRLMLRTYRMNAISDKSFKFYPLSEYLNKDIMAYIAENGIMQPEKYDHAQSSGDDIGDINYLLYLKAHYPNDLAKVISEYPDVERLLFEYEYNSKGNEETRRK